jgi:hypothetical protein
MSSISSTEAVWTAAMASEDSAGPLDGGDRTAPAPATGREAEAGRAQSVCELYVSRDRLAEIMDLSLRSIDRMVMLGMPSETWGLRVRRFQPSVALAWAQTYTEVIL